jgi:hypothetical protein
MTNDQDAEIGRLRAVMHRKANELDNLISLYTVAEENALRVVSLLHSDAHRIAEVLRNAANEGASHDEL